MRNQVKHSRRHFLKCASLSPLLIAGCKRSTTANSPVAADELSDFSAIVNGTDAHAFLQEAAKAFKGTTIRVLTEDTPPSIAAQKLTDGEFSRLTGINVEWILEPLDQVYARCEVDTAQESGYHDLFYIDQSWRGRFNNDLEEISPYLTQDDLAYPHWNFSDFLPTLVSDLSSYEKRLIGVPFDITIFIGAYRRDLLEQVGLKPPRDLDDWLNTARIVTKECAPQHYGTTAQWRLGHYALNCNMTSWLWGFGGSVYNAEKQPVINDEAAIEGLEYMMQLQPCVPPAATTWDWHGEAQSFMRGEAALWGSWGEYFPLFDDPSVSKVADLCEPIAMPLPKKLRPPEECGFDETPGVSHQGGSSLAISRYSKHKEAAWLFLQWVTSSDIAVRSCLLGGGATATRSSVYTDPRILSRGKIRGPGTTRHFPALQDAILKHMGTEPSHAHWAELSRDYFSVELGKMLTSQQSVRETADAMQKHALKFA